ncbi:MAG: hypothetical protein ACR5K7_05170 [Symbiopectobacterium sp.]
MNVNYIVITRDISHDGGTLSYEIFFENMDSLRILYPVLPGHHDDIGNLDAAIKIAKNAVTVEQLSSVS